MSPSSQRRPGPVVFMLAGAVALGAPGCGVRHEYVTREYTEPIRGERGTPGAGPEPGPLLVEVKFPAGGIRLHAGSVDDLYSASITACRTHTVTSALLSPAAEPAAGRRLAIRLEGRPGVFAGFGGEHNVMDLSVAPGLPASYDLDLGEGESVLDMRGLWVRRLHLRAGAGDTSVSFGAPNPGEADEVVVEATIGDLSIDQAGNAGAASLTVRGGVGSLEVDLSGTWRRDASVLIEGSVGDVVLRLPAEETGVRLVAGSPWDEGLTARGLARRGEAFYSEGYDAAARKLDLRIEAGIGALHILEKEPE